MASGKNQQSGASNANSDSQGDYSQVVMRKPRNRIVYETANNNNGGDRNDNSDDTGKKYAKHVKWSESTELRERLKVCRRSQLDIPLDYHHYPIEEKREREGVQVWRTLLKKKLKDDGDDDSLLGEIETRVGAVADTGTSKEDDAAAVRNSADYDTDEGDPDFDEDLERRLQLIKEETTKFTLYPAYTAAIPVYENWLTNTDNLKELTEERVDRMRSQLDLYKRLVEIYKEWTEQSGAQGSRFGEITSILQEASNLGQPPTSVSKMIKEVLADEENVQKQVDTYNSLVQEMISSLEITSKV